jgi:hypothetical protein
MDEAPPPALPPAVLAPPAPKPKSRTWFVVLAWITLVIFGIFVAGITIVTASIPQIKKAREASR